LLTFESPKPPRWLGIAFDFLPTAEMMNSKSNKIDWIQGLRGVAALLVVLCHAREYLLQNPSFKEISSVLIPGAMGVDLFFVISGFIMVYSTQGGSGVDYAKDFAIKRFSRIFPLYFIVSVLWILVVKRNPEFFFGIDNLIVFAKSIFFIPVSNAHPLFHAPVVSLGWTLNFEIYFYVVFGLSLLFGKFKTHVLMGWMALTLILVPATFSEFSFAANKNHGYTLTYLNLATNPIIFEFLAGFLIAKLYLKDSIVFPNITLAKSSVAISLALVIWLNYSGYSSYGPMSWGAPIMLFVACLAIASKTVEFKVPSSLVWLGKISFSLYLTHYLTRAALDYMVLRTSYRAIMHGWGYVIFTSVVAVYVAALFHLLIEIKLSNLVKNILERKLIGGKLQSMKPALS